MQDYDLKVKKRPTQKRSIATFDAMVDACTMLLIKRGYAATTTNHIADKAGVAISSLYQYFPSKDAVVAEVAIRLINRVLGDVLSSATEISLSGDDAVKRMIELFYQTLEKEKELIRVIIYEVPYVKELEEVNQVPAMVIKIAESLQVASGGKVRFKKNKASLYLTVILISSTIMLMVLHPPSDISTEEMIDALVERLESWFVNP